MRMWRLKRADWSFCLIGILKYTELIAAPAFEQRTMIVKAMTRQQVMRSSESICLWLYPFKVTSNVWARRTRFGRVIDLELRRASGMRCFFPTMPFCIRIFRTFIQVRNLFFFIINFYFDAMIACASTTGNIVLLFDHKNHHHPHCSSLSSAEWIFRLRKRYTLSTFATCVDRSPWVAGTRFTCSIATSLPILI